MKALKFIFLSLWAAVLGFMPVGQAPAQSFTTVHSFAGKFNVAFNNEGAGPRTGFILSGNTLYGTAYYGGAAGAGTVFKVNTDGSSFTVLHTFSLPVFN